MPTPLQNGIFYLRLISILLLTQYATANVEKTIFVAPLPWTVTGENAAIDDLGLDRLSPADYMLRTNLNASFPTDEKPYGTESWFYLEDLTPGQRYEVRICWMATVILPILLMKRIDLNVKTATNLLRPHDIHLPRSRLIPVPSPILTQLLRRPSRRHITTIHLPRLQSATPTPESHSPRTRPGSPRTNLARQISPVPTHMGRGRLLHYQRNINGKRAARHGGCHIRSVFVECVSAVVGADGGVYGCYCGDCVFCGWILGEGVE